MTKSGATGPPGVTRVPCRYWAILDVSDDPDALQQWNRQSLDQLMKLGARSSDEEVLVGADYNPAGGGSRCSRVGGVRPACPACPTPEMRPRTVVWRAPVTERPSGP